MVICSYNGIVCIYDPGSHLLIPMVQGSYILLSGKKKTKQANIKPNVQWDPFLYNIEHIHV